jgi:hypothetical protein
LTRRPARSLRRAVSMWCLRGWRAERTSSNDRGHRVVTASRGTRVRRVPLTAAWLKVHPGVDGANVYIAGAKVPPVLPGMCTLLSLRNVHAWCVP